MKKIIDDCSLLDIFFTVVVAGHVVGGPVYTVAMPNNSQIWTMQGPVTVHYKGGKCHSYTGESCCPISCRGISHTPITTKADAIQKAEWPSH